MTTSPVPQGSIWRVLLGAIIVLVLAWFAVEYLFPNGTGTHRFRSPDRSKSLDLNETCTETGCTRSAVLTIGLPGTPEQRTCAVPVTGPVPQLPNAIAVWAESGTSLDVIYADAEGEGGRFTLNFARDCTAG